MTANDLKSAIKEQCEHGQSLDQPCAECGRTGPPEPDPLTPEESYKLARWTPRNALTYPHPVDLIAMLDALRDMIASRDRELDRLTDSHNRLDNRVGALESRPTMTWKGVRQGVPLPDPDEDPETVAVPRKLMDQLDAWIVSPGTNWTRLKAQYDAWKAGQR